MKGKILNRVAGCLLGVGFGVQALAIMRRDNLKDGRRASLRAAICLKNTCEARIKDIIAEEITDIESNAFNAGYFTPED